MQSHELIASQIEATKKRLEELMQNNLIEQSFSKMDENKRLREENERLIQQMRQFYIETLMLLEQLQRSSVQPNSLPMPTTHQVEPTDMQLLEALIATSAGPRQSIARSSKKPFDLFPLLATPVSFYTPPPRPQTSQATVPSVPTSAISPPSSSASPYINNGNQQLNATATIPTKLEPWNIIRIIKHIGESIEGERVFYAVKLQFLSKEATIEFFNNFAAYAKNPVARIQIHLLCNFECSELSIDLLMDSPLYRESYKKNSIQKGYLILEELQKHVAITSVSTVFFNGDAHKEITDEEAEKLLKNDDTPQSTMSRF